MGNRILKESIKFSDEIAQLSFFAEVSFLHLLVTVDDFGRYYADPKKLRHILFPNHDVEISDMKAALRELVDADLIEVYCVEGKWYLQIKTWDKHQQIRNKRSKYPAMNSTDDDCNQVDTHEEDFDAYDDGCIDLKSIDINCNQMKSLDSNCLSESNPIQSNIQSEYESKEQQQHQHQLQIDHDDEVDLHQIRDDHDAIFNLWKKCGFTLSDRVMDQLVDLYSEHGLAKVMESIKITADANPKAPMQYLPKVLADYGKPKPAPAQQVKVTQQKVLPAQNYTQRAYSDADEIDYADRIMFGEVKV